MASPWDIMVAKQAERNGIVNSVASPAEKSRRNAIQGLIDQGVTDPGQLFDSLNYDDDGNEIGDITPEEIERVLRKLTR